MPGAMPLSFLESIPCRFPRATDNDVRNRRPGPNLITPPTSAADLKPVVEPRIPVAGLHVASLRYAYCESTLQGMRQSVALAETLRGAVAVRQADFLAGRLCARHALQSAGLAHPVDLPIGTRGEPAWPAGYLGSITHDGGHAIAAVGPNTRFSAIGIDLQQALAESTADEIRAQVATDRDLRLRPGSWPDARWLTLLFSAKESLFKALHADVGRYFDFQDASATGFDEPGRGLTLSLTARLSGRHFQGAAYPIGFDWREDRLLTWCILR